MKYLKHLSQKPICKQEYSESEINTIRMNSSKSSKEKERIWKKADYEKNKNRYLEAKSNQYDPAKRAEQYKRSKIKENESLLKRRYESFIKDKGKVIDDIKSEAQTSETMSELEKIKDMVNATKGEN